MGVHGPKPHAHGTLVSSAARQQVRSRNHALHRDRLALLLHQCCTDIHLPHRALRTQCDPDLGPSVRMCDYHRLGAGVITMDQTGMAALRLQSIANSVLGNKSNLQHRLGACVRRRVLQSHSGRYA
jgi:hypothetical protein